MLRGILIFFLANVNVCAWMLVGVRTSCLWGLGAVVDVHDFYLVGKVMSCLSCSLHTQIRSRPMRWSEGWWFAYLIES